MVITPLMLHRSCQTMPPSPQLCSVAPLALVPPGFKAVTEPVRCAAQACRCRGSWRAASTGRCARGSAPPWPACWTRSAAACCAGASTMRTRTQATSCCRCASGPLGRTTTRSWNLQLSFLPQGEAGTSRLGLVLRLASAPLHGMRCTALWSPTGPLGRSARCSGHGGKIGALSGRAVDAEGGMLCAADALPLLPTSRRGGGRAGVCCFA